jgi:hypothetical protein
MSSARAAISGRSSRSRSTIALSPSPSAPSTRARLPFVGRGLTVLGILRLLLASCLSTSVAFEHFLMLSSSPTTCPATRDELAALAVYACPHPNAQRKGCFSLLVPVFARMQSPHHALLHLLVTTPSVHEPQLKPDATVDVLATVATLAIVKKFVHCLSHFADTQMCCNQSTGARVACTGVKRPAVGP